MNTDKIKDLIQQIDQSSLMYFEYEKDQEHLILSKIDQLPSYTIDQKMVADAPIQAAVESVPTQKGPEASASLEPSKEKPEAEGYLVTSPIVGVFYEAPGPEEKPFVQVGDQVKVGDVLCIVEAMKLMNEIKSERAGVISAVYPQNGEMVDFNAPLFQITD